VTLPLFLALHLVYGTVMGMVLFPRMRAEGEVLGPPLLLTLVPVAVVTAPVGAVLLRYCGGWFLHGAFIGEGNITYERFHFGLLLLVGLGAGLATVAGMFHVVAFRSRDKPAFARLPIYAAVAIGLAVFALDGERVVTIVGTNGRHLWAHPAGLLSLAVVVVLVAFVALTRARFAAVPSLSR
jgi:hypothetical protein